MRLRQFPASAQGLIISIPHPTKSVVLRVARTAEWQATIAAIWQSNWLIGRPAERRLTAMAA